MRRAFLCATTILLGCGDPLGPGRSELDVLFGDLDIAERIVSRALIASDGSFLPIFGGPLGFCVLDAASVTFRCPPLVRSSGTFERSFQLLDAAAEPLTEFDPAVIDALRAIGTLNDTSASSSGGVVFERRQYSDHTLGGLLGDQRTLAGTIDHQFVVTAGAQVDTMRWLTATDLVLPPRGSSTYPTGTLVTRSIFSGQGDTDTTTVTLNGTAVVTAVQVRSGSSLTCTFNLETLSQSCVLTPAP